MICAPQDWLLLWVVFNCEHERATIAIAPRDTKPQITNLIIRWPVVELKESTPTCWNTGSRMKLKNQSLIRRGGSGDKKFWLTKLLHQRHN